MARENTKELIIISGANGVGKTTFAKPYVERIGYKFLNADEIAKEIEGEGLQNAMIKAGRVFFTELNKSLSSCENVVIETTLSGSYVKKVATSAKAKGYWVKVIYIFVDSEDLCVERVRSRVLKGGHDVPEMDIRRRFKKSLNNFWNDFTKLASLWMLLYNGDENYQQVAIGSDDYFSVENEELFKFFKIIKE